MSQHNRERRDKGNRGPTGPHALQEWVQRWHPLFRSAYRTALAKGYPPSFVVWAMPLTERVVDPPVGFDVQSREEASATLRRLPSVATSLDDPPWAGYFYIVASRAEGRFKGTFVA